jgi:hypothetical protein
MGRGFFRLWIVLTLVWGAFIIFAFGYDTRPDAFAIAAKAILIPSIIVLAIGFLLRWALRGFSHRS